VVQGFLTADRGQLIMACGTSKTYVTLWIKEHLGAQTTLVLVPSLGLLSQLLREWTFAAATPFEVLCVCSDQTVGTKGNDEAIRSVADLAFPVTSDADEVKRFLSGAGNRVVFATYQSSAVIGAAQADPSIPAFDLVVADEAHRCAGKVGSDFATVLDNTQIRSAKRLILAQGYFNNKAGQDHFNTKAVRAMTRRPALLAALYENPDPVTVNGKPTVAVNVDRERFDLAIERICQGLCVKSSCERWTKEIKIYTLILLTMNETADKRVNDFSKAIIRKLENVAKQGDNPDIFWYQLLIDKEKDRLLCRMAFYGGFDIFAVSDPSLRGKST